MRGVTKKQIGDKIMKAADRYWRLKKDHGLPEDLEIVVKYAFIKGWTESEKSKKENGTT